MLGFLIGIQEIPDRNTRDSVRHLHKTNLGIPIGKWDEKASHDIGIVFSMYLFLANVSKKEILLVAGN